MIGRVKLIKIGMIFCAVGPMATGGSAVTAEVAKKCEVLTAKAFPPRVVGNPAAGSAKGSGRDQRAYFNKCVENGGKVDDGSSKDTNSGARGTK